MQFRIITLIKGSSIFFLYIQTSQVLLKYNVTATVQQQYYKQLL